MNYHPNGQPRHVRPVRADSTPIGATCTRRESDVCGFYCPRHNPTAYADQMARHAVDSIGPIPTAEQLRAERYHTFGITR